MIFASIFFFCAMLCVSVSMGERRNARRKQPGVEAAELQEDDGAYNVRNIEADMLVQESLEPQQPQRAQTNPSVDTILATFGNIFLKQRREERKAMEDEKRRRDFEWDKFEQERNEQMRRLEEERQQKEDRKELERRQWQAEFQQEMEMKRQEHELKILHIQAQKEEERKLYEDSRKIVDSIPKMTDSDQPEAYLCRFEELLNEAGIPVQQWAKRLKPLLTGKALNAYARDVPEDSKGDYNRVKEALLNALGMTHTQCVEELFRYEKKQNLTMPEAIRQVEFILARLFQECTTKDEMMQTLLIARVYSWSSSECAAFIRLQKPITAGQAAMLFTEYNRTHHERRLKHWQKGDERRRDDGKWRYDTRNGYDKHSDRSGDRGFDRRQDRGRKNFKDQVWIPTCFSCQEKGHKSNECPKNRQKQTKSAQVRVVVTPTPKQPKLVKGRVGSNTCNMLLDSGANVTVVAARLVEVEQYLPETIQMTGVNGIQVSHPKAKIWLHVGSFSIPHVVAVVKDLSDDVILGLDLGDAFDELLLSHILEHKHTADIQNKHDKLCVALNSDIEKEGCVSESDSGRKECSKTVNVSGMNESLNGVMDRDGSVSEKIIEEVRITRRQRKRKEEQMRQTERIEAEEGASALYPDSLAEKKRECIEEVNVETVGMDVITVLGKVEIERENVQTVRGEDDIDIPIVQECVSDREKLKKEIFDDDSLKNLR